MRKRRVISFADRVIRPTGGTPLGKKRHTTTDKMGTGQAASKTRLSRGRMKEKKKSFFFLSFLFRSRGPNQNRGRGGGYDVLFHTVCSNLCWTAGYTVGPAGYPIGRPRSAKILFDRTRVVVAVYFLPIVTDSRRTCCQ